MNKAELEAEVVRLQREIQRRDRIIRVCYYRVQQIHDIKQQVLLDEMAEWAPRPQYMKPQVGRRAT